MHTCARIRTRTYTHAHTNNITYTHAPRAHQQLLEKRVTITGTNRMDVEGRAGWVISFKNGEYEVALDGAIGMTLKFKPGVLAVETKVGTRQQTQD